MERRGTRSQGQCRWLVLLAMLTIVPQFRDEDCYVWSKQQAFVTSGIFSVQSGRQGAPAGHQPQNAKICGSACKNLRKSPTTVRRAAADLSRSAVVKFWPWFMTYAKTDDRNLEKKQRIFEAIESERDARDRGGPRSSLNRGIVSLIEDLVNSNPTPQPAKLFQEKELLGKWFLEYATRPSQFPRPMQGLKAKSQFGDDGIPLYMLLVFREDGNLTRQLAVSKLGVKQADWFNMDSKMSTKPPNKLVETPIFPPEDGFACQKTRGRAFCLGLDDQQESTLAYLDNDILVVLEPEGAPYYQIFTRRGAPARPGKRGFLLEEV